MCPRHIDKKSDLGKQKFTAGWLHVHIELWENDDPDPFAWDPISALRSPSWPLHPCDYEIANAALFNETVKNLNFWTNVNINLTNLDYDIIHCKRVKECLGQNQVAYFILRLEPKRLGCCPSVPDSGGLSSQGWNKSDRGKSWCGARSSGVLAKKIAQNRKQI